MKELLRFLCLNGEWMSGEMRKMGGTMKVFEIYEGSTFTAAVRSLMELFPAKKTPLFVCLFVKKIVKLVVPLVFVVTKSYGTFPFFFFKEVRG